jgi:hypothetical protein
MMVQPADDGVKARLMHRYFAGTGAQVAPVFAFDRVSI